MFPPSAAGNRPNSSSAALHLEQRPATFATCHNSIGISQRSPSVTQITFKLQQISRFYFSLLAVWLHCCFLRLAWTRATRVHPGPQSDPDTSGPKSDVGTSGLLSNLGTSKSAEQPGYAQIRMVTWALTDLQSNPRTSRFAERPWCIQVHRATWYIQVHRATRVCPGPQTNPGMSRSTGLP